MKEGIGRQDDLPEYAFQPDEWNHSLWGGLEAAAIEGCNVLEVGAGPGTNVSQVLNQGVNHLYLAEYDARVTKFAGEYVTQLPAKKREKITIIEGSSNLLDFPSEALMKEVYEVVKYVFACIPQAIKPEGAPDNPDDDAHYYPAKFFDEYIFNRVALGLNEKLLAQVSERMPESRIALNLGGRVGLDTIRKMFDHQGFDSQILHQIIIPQCISTRLDFYATLEGTKIFHDHYLGTDQPFECEFFGDPEGQVKISAAEAEARRSSEFDRKIGLEREGQIFVPDPSNGVYHNIYVVEGQPIRA